MYCRDDIVDVSINDWSLLEDLACAITAITISPLIKKQYLLDIVGADGAKDLLSWFGAPHFESRTLTVRAQCCREGAAQCAARLSNLFAGQSVNIRLSNDCDVYRTGTVTQISATGPLLSDEVIITILCDPYRYNTDLTLYRISASPSATSHTWLNGGARNVAPEIVSESDTVLEVGDSRYTLTAGHYLLSEITIPGGSSITVQVIGGPITVSYREAIL